MIETDFPELFYKNSPFLPQINTDDVIEMRSTMKTKGVSLLNAAAQQAGHIGAVLNTIHEISLQSITKSFSCTANDLVYFYIGFTTPIQLILSAQQMDKAHIKTVIGNLSQPTNLQIMQRHNKHKVGLLHDAYYIVANMPEAKAQSAISNIRTLCRKRPFSFSKYYLAGIDAGSYTIKLLIQNSK